MRAADQLQKQARLLSLGSRFGPIFALSLVWKDEEPQKARAFGPGRLGPVFHQSALDLRSRSAQTGSPDLGISFLGNLAGSPYEVFCCLDFIRDLAASGSETRVYPGTREMVLRRMVPKDEINNSFFFLGVEFTWAPGSVKPIRKGGSRF